MSLTVRELNRRKTRQARRYKGRGYKLGATSTEWGTLPGWPRPRNADGVFVPWLSPPESLGKTLAERAYKVKRGDRCQLCGLALEEDIALGFTRTDGPPPKPREGNVAVEFIIDNGLLHRHCALLAAKHCPRLRQLREIGELHLVVVPTRQGTSMLPVLGVEPIP